MIFMLMSREKHEVNTDPQRRCYAGCHFSSEWRWGDWQDLCPYLSEQDADDARAVFAAATKEAGRKLEYKVEKRTLKEQV